MTTPPKEMPVSFLAEYLTLAIEAFEYANARGKTVSDYSHQEIYMMRKLRKQINEAQAAWDKIQAYEAELAAEEAKKHPQNWISEFFIWLASGF